jgi:hypothetical protein
MLLVLAWKDTAMLMHVLVDPRADHVAMLCTHAHSAAARAHHAKPSVLRCSKHPHSAAYPLRTHAHAHNQLRTLSLLGWTVWLHG